jgi:hypothetical protein
MLIARTTATAYAGSIGISVLVSGMSQSVSGNLVIVRNFDADYLCDMGESWCGLSG